jgi:hypothetical protein
MRIIACALASGVALGLTGGAASAQQQFDGNWSVEVTTQQGGCAKAYRFPVAIQNGQVHYGGVSGAVSPSGALRGSLGRGPVQANVVGRLSERSGSGTWAGSGSLGCSGRWRAEKRA